MIIIIEIIVRTQCVNDLSKLCNDQCHCWFKEHNVTHSSYVHSKHCSTKKEKRKKDWGGDGYGGGRHKVQVLQ